MRLFVRCLLLSVIILVSSCAPYGRCGDFEVGDEVRLTIEEFKSGELCDPRLKMGVGSVLEVAVDAFLAGDRCESATGPVRDVAGEIRFQEIEDTQASQNSHSDFWGEYEFETAECSGWFQLSFALPAAGEAFTEAEVYAQSSDCAVECGFSSVASAVRF